MLTVLYGVNRFALKDYCLESAVQMIEADPFKRVLIIVPEQTKLDVENELLSRLDKSAILAAEVLSFRRLAWRLLSEAGEQPANRLDALGRAMLILKALHEKKDQLQTFGSLAGRPGFVGQLASVMGDLKRYCIGPLELLAVAEQVEDRALQNKSRDLAELITRYEQLKAADGLVDSDDDLNQLAGLLKRWNDADISAWPWSRLNWLKRAAVVVSGFGEVRDFTPQEDLILDALIRLSESLTLSVVADNVESDGLGTESFNAGRHTAKRLLKRWPSARLFGVDDQLTPGSRQILNILRTGTKDENQTIGEGYLNLVEAENIEQEIAWTAGRIRQLVQVEGYRYKDITLAISNVAEYEARLRTVFKTYGIPLFFSGEHSLNKTPFMRFILSVLETGLTNWSRNAVMGCLRSGLSGLTGEEADLLENVCLARGLFREDLLFTDQNFYSFTKSDQKTAVDAQYLIELRDRAFKGVRQLVQHLNKLQESTRMVAALGDFLEQLNLAERVQLMADRIIAGGESDPAATLLRSWNIFQELLEQIKRLFGGEQITLKWLYDLCLTASDTATAVLLPSAIDQVSVGDLNQSMLRQRSVLFLIGASAGNLPPAQPPEGLLKDPDRQAMSQVTGQSIPSRSRDKAFADSFILETLLAQPRQKIFMLAPDANHAQVFANFKDNCGSSYQKIGEIQDLSDPRLNVKERAWHWFLSRDPVQTDALLAQIPEFKHILVPVLPEQDLTVQPQLISQIYGQQVLVSVSQLEQYAKCPFQQFAERILALKDRLEWQPERTESGIILHTIMEKALREIKAELTRWPADPDLFWQQWLAGDLSLKIEQWLEAAVSYDRTNRVLADGLNASIGRWIRRAALATLTGLLRQFQRGDYLPAEFEWHFHPARHNALPVVLKDGTTIAIQGKIDRIDRRLVAGTDQFRVIDYKSSDKKVDFNSLYHGLDLQLPIYVAAYSAANPLLEPGDAAWITMTRPLINLGDKIDQTVQQLEKHFDRPHQPLALRLDPPDLKLLCRHSVRKAADYAEQILAGKFAARPSQLVQNRLPCEFCRFNAICGFNKKKDQRRQLKSLTVTSTGGRDKAKELFLQKLNDAINGEENSGTD